jgi:hypothetical protein
MAGPTAIIKEDVRAPGIVAPDGALTLPSGRLHRERRARTGPGRDNRNTAEAHP